MMTMRQWSDDNAKAPLGTTWSVEELGRALGMQAMFTRQSPQKLAALREHALIESAQSSNRIEGVEVDAARLGTLVFGAPTLRNRDEEEVNGYRRALDLIHSSAARLTVSEETIRQVHQLTRGDIWDAGLFKERSEPIIERRPGQSDRVRFMPVEAGAATEAAIAELLTRYHAIAPKRRISPLVPMAGFVCGI